jgi:two-component sensor histidine kinase
MQIISSLMKLQARHSKNREAVDLLTESRNRVKAMALVHEKLYASGDMADIDFRYDINDLAVSLYRAYKKDPGKISLKTDVGNVTFNIDTAIPCGLIINELLSNALRHAFPRGREGEILIALQRAGEHEFELAVSDDGIGIPGDIDIRNTNTLGLQLVTSITEDQLGGKLETIRDGGTGFRITFRELEYERRT